MEDEMLPVGPATRSTLRSFMLEKITKDECTRFLSAPHPALGGKSPDCVLETGDHFELMTLSTLVAHMSPRHSAETLAA